MKKQREGTGLTEEQIVFEDDALKAIIRNYTREAGVRNLEREIGNVCRKVARKVVQTGPEHREVLTGENLGELLGVAKFRDSQVHEKSEVGLVTGLAWTEVGGTHSADRSSGAGWQGQADHDRPAGRGDAGVGAGGDELHPLARAAPGAGQGVLPARRHPRACARGRDPEGWAVGGHYAGDRHWPAR